MAIKRVVGSLFLFVIAVAVTISALANVGLGYGIYVQFKEIKLYQERESQILTNLNECIETNKILQAKVENALVPQGSIGEILSDGWNGVKSLGNSAAEGVKEGWNSLFNSEEKEVVEQAPVQQDDILEKEYNRSLKAFLDLHSR